MSAAIPVVSLTYGAYLVLATYPCSVCGVQVNTTTEPGWVLLLDESELPDVGHLDKAPVKTWQVPAAYTLTVGFDTNLAMQVGAILVFSISGPYDYTPSGTALFSGEVVL